MIDVSICYHYICVTLLDRMKKRVHAKDATRDDSRSMRHTLIRSTYKKKQNGRG